MLFLINVNNSNLYFNYMNSLYMLQKQWHVMTCLLYLGSSANVVI